MVSLEEWQCCCLMGGRGERRRRGDGGCGHREPGVGGSGVGGWGNGWMVTGQVSSARGVDRWRKRVTRTGQNERRDVRRGGCPLQHVKLCRGLKDRAHRNAEAGWRDDGGGGVERA